LFVEAKLEASKELSQYIDQLNVSLEEKRVVFQMARKGLWCHYVIAGRALTTWLVS